jgi:hypothetical protein
MKSEYKFQYTKQNGYDKVYLSRKYHKRLFPNRTITWTDRYDYFLKPNEEFVMCRSTSYIAKILNIIFYPLAVLAHGIVNYKEINRDIARDWNSLDKGSFVLDSVRNNTRDRELFQTVMNHIKTKKGIL